MPPTTTVTFGHLSDLCQKPFVAGHPVATTASRNVFEMLTTAPPLALYASDTCMEVTFVAITPPGFPGVEVNEPLTAPPPSALTVLTLFGVPTSGGLEMSALTCRIFSFGGAMVKSMAMSYDTVKLDRKFPSKVTVWKSANPSCCT